MKTKILLLSAAALLLSACATPTPYQPAAEHYDEGYSDQRIETNRWRIRFAGNSQTPKTTVENYLLYRAAELTLANGFDYFVTAQQSTEADTRYQQTYSGGFGYYWWYPRAALGVSTAYPVTEFEATADVVMFKGGKPASDPRAFDARDVKQNLETLVVRPQPRS